MSEVLKNRSEILFLYDVTDANPNGDPMEENRPRIDEETSINIITDVRLKRSIRDYLRDFKDQDIFIQAEKVVEEGTELIKARGAKLIEEMEELLDKEMGKSEAEGIKSKLEEILKEGGRNDRKKLFNKALGDGVNDETKNELFIGFEEIRTKKLREKLFDKFIDLRLFGATIAVSNIGVQETGPVQFKPGRSLHKVDLNFYKGSLTMPVEPGRGFKKGKKQAEFSEEYRLPYSLISFYGIGNENSAKNTGLSEDDMEILLDGLWNGTKNLITRSKMGQMPRFLLRIIHKEQNFHIGDLDKMISLKDHNKKDISVEKQERIRDISEVRLDISELVDVLKEHYKKDKIAKIEFQADTRLKFLIDKSEWVADELKNKMKEKINMNDNEIVELNL